MDTLRELYQEIILDHNKSPKNFKTLTRVTHRAEGYNPLCGDRIQLQLYVQDDIVVDVGFQGSGCAISKASASVMTAMIKGKTIEEVQKLFEKFKQTVTSRLDNDLDLTELGSLAAFVGVREFPTRVKCATLAWHTLHSALSEQGKKVSTE